MATPTPATRSRRIVRTDPLVTPIVRPDVIRVRTSRGTDSTILIAHCPGCGALHRHLLAGTRIPGCGTRYELVIS